MNKKHLIGVVLVGACAASSVGGCTISVDIGIDTQGDAISTGVGGSGDVVGGGIGGAGGVEPGVTGVGGASMSGVGGSGGLGEGGVSTSGVGGSGGVGGGGMGGAGGAGGSPACFDEYPGCGDYITSDFPGPWCDEVIPDPTPGSTNPSYVLYNDLFVCVCGDPDNPVNGGKCKTQCNNEMCAGMPIVSGGPCLQCMTDNDTGCGGELNDCANDV